MTMHRSVSIAEALEHLDQHRDTPIKIGVTDIDGVVRGKFLGRNKFIAGLTSGLSICDCLFAWDVNDTLYDGFGTTAASGWHTGFPDAPLRIAEESLRFVSTAQGEVTLMALCSFDGVVKSICPRNVLARVTERAGEMGLSTKCGFEYEFTLLRETGESLRDTTAKRLTALTHGNFGYSLLKTSTCAPLFYELQKACGRYGIPLEALHTENGPGMWEAALGATNAVQAADHAALFKLATKEVAAENQLIACFMAKWSPAPQGQGGHIHISLADNATGSTFFSDSNPEQVNDSLRHFVGGQQRLMPALTAMAAPTVNSYKRLVPGTWAPTVASWGIDNRTCALRVIGRSPDSRRVEYRLAGADANPYLALGAALASGLHGIENELEPTAPTSGDAYDQSFDDGLRLPRDLLESSALLRQSEAAASWFGREFVEHFSMSREWEHMQFAKHVSDWELARYAEII